VIEGLYIHIPFCAKRCHYCDFNTYEGMEGLAPEYVDALKQDLGRAEGFGAPLKSVFFGGGTPSLLSASQVGELLKAVRLGPGLAQDAEVTLEANPGTADLEKFEGFLRAGVNRLSFGFQARQESHLRALGRIHDSSQSAQAWKLARQAGFGNLSLDLMFGLPDQTLEEWQESLEWALAFQPEHLSFYGLTIEPGTRFHHLHSQGLLPVPGEDLQADMYSWGMQRLAQAGLAQYEISNFSRPGRESVHNRLYWLNRETLGIGAGAWSYVSGLRYSREKNTPIYIEAVQKGLPVIRESERLEGSKARGEAAYLGLRLLEGIDLAVWRAENGLDLLNEFGQAADGLLKDGFLELSENRLKLTTKGIPVANHVFSAFL
jgi:oxygen-independent coproporphyrinogen-3 oxidase